MNTTALSLALACGLSAASAAMATSTFDLYRNDPAAGACTQIGSNSGIGNSYDCSATVPGFDDELTITSYSNTGSGSTFAAAKLGDYNSSGFGVTGNGESTGSPQHALDNDGNLEMILFKFDSSIALTSFRLGWWQNDSDLSVLAYTGVGDAVADLTNATKGSLLSTGWSLVGNHFNNYNNTISINSGAVSSSYWIVSAYADNFGGTSGFEGGDYVKLQTVSGNFTCVNSNDPSCQAPPVTGVSEPASLALAGIALLGVFGTRRRMSAAAA